MPECECGKWVRDGNELRDHRHEQHPEGYRQYEAEERCPSCQGPVKREGACRTCRECAWEECGGVRI